MVSENNITKNDLAETYRKHINKLKEKKAKQGHLDRDDKRSLMWKTNRLKSLTK